jgi:hypothetical protein
VHLVPASLALVMDDVSWSGRKADNDDKTCWRCGYKVSGSICAMCGAVNRAAEDDLHNEYEVPTPVICARLNDRRKKRGFFGLVGRSCY